jgi:hypothetical protein
MYALAKKTSRAVYIVGAPKLENKMKSFLDWTREEKLALPTFTDAAQPKKTVEEKTKRTGLSANYPDAYVASQYPHKYFNPTKATTDLDIQNINKKDVH